MWQEITDPSDLRRLHEANLLWRQVGVYGRHKPNTSPWDKSETMQAEWDLIGYGSTLATTRFFILLEE